MKDKQTNFLKSIIGNQHRRFIAGGHTCFDVFCLASSVRRLTLPDEPLCVWTQDKTFIAAAILAAVYGGPRIIIPYAFSPQALDEARACFSFSKILSVTKEALPADCTVIGPDNVKSDSPLVLSGFVADTPRIWLFTGGSTEKPKLWSKTARNLFGEALLLAKTFAIGPNDCILSSVPPQHIYGLLFSVLVPLVSGCTVIEPVFSFPHEILSAASDMGATIMVSVPSQYHVLKSENLKRHNLRLAFSSAGMLPISDAEYFYGRTGIAINDIYGSTETGGIAWKAAPNDRQMYHAFKGIDWKIHKGRLQLASDFLSPELTLDQNGFFTTADRAEPCGSDRFILHGRADSIVKVGGRRVDLSEVCDKIKTLSGVRDAVVFAIDVRTGRGSDIAALVAGTADPSSIRAGLAKICEPYAVPRHIKNVESIPVSQTGKYARAMIEKLFRLTDD